MAKTKTLSPQLAAALASGASVVESAATVATPATAAATTPEAVTATPAVVVEATAATTPETPNETATTETTAAATTPAPDGSAALVAHLKQELSTLRQNETALTIKLSNLTQENTTLKAVETSLTGIVRSAAKRLCVALNASSVTIDTASGTALCDMFTNLDKEFTTKYKVGATASTETTETAPNAENTDEGGNAHIRSAAVQAASSRKK